MIVQHQSLPMLEILSSSCPQQQSRCRSVGPNDGWCISRHREGRSRTLPTREILIINGSGLGQENRLSPRAAAGLFQAIQRHLRPDKLTVADLFPVASRDLGTIKKRNLPNAAVVKTGTLWNVSALAGVLPTRAYGPVWFTIINGGPNHTEGFRREQDRFLQALRQRWGLP